MSTPIHSAYAGVETPAQMLARKKELKELYGYRFWPHAAYRPIGLTVDEFDGTVWRNCHTGEKDEANRRRGVHFGPFKPWTFSAKGTVKRGGYLYVDTDAAKLVEHWIRVDQLPIDVQRQWHLHRLEVLAEDMADGQVRIDRMERADPDTISCYAANLGIARNSVERISADADEAQEELRRFDELHGFATETRDLNKAVRTGGQTRLL